MKKYFSDEIMQLMSKHDELCESIHRLRSRPSTSEPRATVEDFCTALNSVITMGKTYHYPLGCARCLQTLFVQTADIYVATKKLKDERSKENNDTDNKADELSADSDKTVSGGIGQEGCLQLSDDTVPTRQGEGKENSGKGNGRGRKKNV